MENPIKIWVSIWIQPCLGKYDWGMMSRGSSIVPSQTVFGSIGQGKFDSHGQFLSFYQKIIYKWVIFHSHGFHNFELS